MSAHRFFTNYYFHLPKRCIVFCEWIIKLPSPKNPRKTFNNRYIHGATKRVRCWCLYLGTWLVVNRFAYWKLWKIELAANFQWKRKKHRNSFSILISHQNRISSIEIAMIGKSFSFRFNNDIFFRQWNDLNFESLTCRSCWIIHKLFVR